jgi:hypothetical protein
LDLVECAGGGWLSETVIVSSWEWEAAGAFSLVGFFELISNVLRNSFADEGGRRPIFVEGLLRPKSVSNSNLNCRYLRWVVGIFLNAVPGGLVNELCIM